MRSSLLPRVDLALSEQNLFYRQRHPSSSKAPPNFSKTIPASRSQNQSTEVKQRWSERSTLLRSSPTMYTSKSKSQNLVRLPLYTKVSLSPCARTTSKKAVLSSAKLPSENQTPNVLKNSMICCRIDLIRYLAQIRTLPTTRLSTQ